jgi:hypothetical protein
MATKKTKKSELVATDLLVEYGDPLEFEQLQQALKPFGLTVIVDPACEGSDTNGYIISNRKLTRAELKEWAERC